MRTPLILAKEWPGRTMPGRAGSTPGDEERLFRPRPGGFGVLVAPAGEDVRQVVLRVLVLGEDDVLEADASVFLDLAAAAELVAVQQGGALVVQ